MQTRLDARTRWCTLGRACLVAAAFAVQGAFGAVEIAGTVDLSAADLSATGLERVHDDRLGEDVVLCKECLVGSGTITNSSETMATLVIVEKGGARVNFAGRITGNIRVVLRNFGGEKWQAFTSDCNDYTGGTWLDGGWIYVSSYDALGTGDITLSNSGRLTYTGDTGVDAGYSGTYNTTLTNRIIVQGHGLLGAYSDKSVTIASEVSMPGARFEITNFGKMTFTRPFTAANVAGGTLDLADARMLAAPAVFGTTSDAVLPLDIRIRSTAEWTSTLSLTEPGTLCVSNIVFAYSAGKCGGGIVGGGAPSQGEAVVRVFGEFSVESGAVSNALAAISIENGVGVGRLSVANDAVLAFSGSLSVPAGNGLIKTGAGTLALLGGCNVTGECRVESGTLELGPNVCFPDTTALRFGRGTRVCLNDGAALTSPVLARDGGVVATADVWFDATALAGYADGDAVSRIPNLGTAGGAFEPSECEQAKRPGLPTYVRSGINGLPALNFDSGTSWPLGLCTKAYTNKTTTITVFHVLLFESWNLGRNKWCMPLASGPFGINSLDLWDTNKGFHYRFNDDKTPAAYQIRSNGINDRWELQEKWKGIREPILCATRRDGVNAYHRAYAADMKDQTRTFLSYDAEAFDIEFLSLGAVVDTWGRVSNNSANNRVFPGKIGEIIVFTRALSDEEIESVNAYLKAKWFGVSDGAAAMYEAPAGQNVEVSVPADATAFLAPGFSVTDDTVTGDWVKTGAGTLQLGGSAAQCTAIAVKEGAVEIVPATETRGALHDSSSLALDFASGTRLVQAGPTVALASLTLADGVSVHRAAPSTAAEAFKLFDISDTLSLAGNLSFACAPSPDRDVPVFSFGTCEDTATWTFDVPGYRQAHFSTGASATWLRLANGTVILFR